MFRGIIGPQNGWYAVAYLPTGKFKKTSQGKRQRVYEEKIIGPCKAQEEAIAECARALLFPAEVYLVRDKEKGELSGWYGYGRLRSGITGKPQENRFGPFPSRTVAKQSTLNNGYDVLYCIRVR
jgi:hypothetical protein